MPQSSQCLAIPRYQLKARRGTVKTQTFHMKPPTHDEHANLVGNDVTQRFNVFLSISAGVFTVLTVHIVPFILLKDLMWQCGVKGGCWGLGEGEVEGFAML